MKIEMELNMHVARTMLGIHYPGENVSNMSDEEIIALFLNMTKIYGATSCRTIDEDNVFYKLYKIPDGEAMEYVNQFKTREEAQDAANKIKTNTKCFYAILRIEIADIICKE